MTLLKTKTCLYCAEEKEVSEFDKSRRAKGGYSNKCKCCAKARRNGHQITRKSMEEILLLQNFPHIPVLMILTLTPSKICTGCTVLQPLDRFNKAERKRYGVDSHCISCSNQRTSKWQRDNPEKVKVRNSRWIQNNKSAHTAREQRRRARKRNLYLEDVTEEELILRDGRLCAWCGEIPESTHIDHFWPLSLGGYHCKENTLISCATCNTQKGAREPQAFIDRQIKLGRKVQLSDRVRWLLDQLKDEEFLPNIRRINYLKEG